MIGPVFCIELVAMAVAVALGSGDGAGCSSAAGVEVCKGRTGSVKLLVTLSRRLDDERTFLTML
jgi:hypothetical protein